MSPHIDRGGMQLAPGGMRLVWLGEVAPACRLLELDGPVGREAAQLLREAATERENSTAGRKAPKAFRHLPEARHAKLLGRALDTVRDPRTVIA